MENRGLIITVISTAVIAVAVVFVFFSPFLEDDIAGSPTPLPSEENKSLGEEISDQVQDPAEKIPETNPFEKVKTNPYEDSYKNPFN